MATSILITGLKTKSTHAHSFVILVFPTSDTTIGGILVTSGSSAAIKINPSDLEYVQAEIIVLSGLTVGTTYYLLAGVEYNQTTNFLPAVQFTPTVTTRASSLQTYPFNVGFTFTYSLTSGNTTDILDAFIYYTLTLPTGLYSMETTYTLDGNVPASPPVNTVGSTTIGGFDPVNLTLNTLSIFTGLAAGQTASVFTRGVDVGGTKYDWQYVGAYSVGGTTGGTLPDPDPPPFYPDPIKGGGFNSPTSPSPA